MSDPYLGEIRTFGFNFAPKGWALCQGQLMSISQNAALFALLGTQFGGTVDGRDQRRSGNAQPDPMRTSVDSMAERGRRGGFGGGNRNGGRGNRNHSFQR